MLICPICQAPLSAVQNGVACPANHRFDRARQGYLNLLPVQHKNSRDPGDNQAMVEARRRFSMAVTMRRWPDASPSWPPSARRNAGWTSAVARATTQPNWPAALPDAEGYALDISREGDQARLQTRPQLEWLVASMARVPLADASCDLLASVFSPLDWQEARRLLAPGGGMLRMGPTREHLWELRARLYDEVRDYDDEKHLSLIPEGMHLAHSETLSYELQLDDAQARADLLAMTPHGWRASAERRAAVIDTPLAVRVAIRYDWIERIS